MAHIDAGKTTTTERILFYTHKKHRIGYVDDGTTSMDWMTQEQERGITIVSAATTCYWDDVQINIIDTPGHVDFTIEVERSLRVLDGAIGIFCAVGGVEPQSETVWRQANRYNVPKIAYINKMDRTGADFFAVVEEIQNKLGVTPIPLTIPIGRENTYEGNIDLMEMREIHWDQNSDGAQLRYCEIRDDLKDMAEEWRDKLLENLANIEEEIADLYLEGKSIDNKLIDRTIRKVVMEQKALPILVGSSLKNKGIQPLLDAIVAYLPGPEELPKLTAWHTKKDKQVQLERSDKERFSALVFKILHDKEMGMVCYIRVYSGSVKSGTSVLNVNFRKKERINRIFRLHANSYEQISELKAGDIGAVIGLKETKTGETLADESWPVSLDTMEFPVPVISVAIEPKTVSDQDKLKVALDNLIREDPTFMVKENDETGQLIISGMGELHLEVLMRRIQDEYKVEANIGNPHVTCRETITKENTVSASYQKTLAGKDHAATITLHVQPDRGKGNRFHSDVPISKLSENWQNSVKQGVQSSFDSGIALGYPCMDVSVTLMDVEYAESTISEIALETATSNAFDKACLDAGPVLMEPVMDVDVACPTDKVGDVIANLTQRGGHVESMESRPTHELVKAKVPLINMFGYSTALRSFTQGRGTFSMEFSHFAIKE